MSDTYENSSVEKLLANNKYPGRGIIIGKTPKEDKAVIAYFIMGRSENSRNRVFEEKGDEVIIYPFDETKVEDPTLIIYSPIKVYKNKIIVTNGDQTDTIYNYLFGGHTFEDALNTREFEPDVPNFTPRISGIVELGKNDFSYKMSILKSADENGSACNRYVFNFVASAGVGHMIHTYNQDGNPLPIFTGEPRRVSMVEDIDEFTNTLWESLDKDNKISLYVRYIDLENGDVDNRFINKNK